MSDDNNDRLAPDTENIDGTGCPICWEPMLEGSQTNNTSCDHKFHSSCLERWFERHNTCPVCRTELFELEEEAEDLFGQEYFFRFRNLALCPTPTFFRARRIQLILSGLLWGIIVYMIYSAIRAMLTWTDFSKHVVSLIFLGLECLALLWITYIIVCLSLRCRYDTGRIYRLELEEIVIEEW